MVLCMTKARVRAKRNKEKKTSICQDLETGERVIIGIKT